MLNRLPLLVSLVSPAATLAVDRRTELVAGPITVFNKVIYDIIEKEPNPPVYLHFIGWVYLWGAIFHWITAVLNCTCHYFRHEIKAGTFCYRVQFPQICHPFLMRHIRFLRVLGLPPIWYPSLDSAATG